MNLLAGMGVPRAAEHAVLTVSHTFGHVELHKRGGISGFGIFRRVGSPSVAFAP